MGFDPLGLCVVVTLLGIISGIGSIIRRRRNDAAKSYSETSDRLFGGKK